MMTYMEFLTSCLVILEIISLAYKIMSKKN